MSETVSEPPEQEPVRTRAYWSIGSILERLPVVANTVAYAIILLLLIAFGGLAIVEIVSRTSIMTFLRAEISANQAFLARENVRPEAISTPTPTPPSLLDSNKFGSMLPPSRDRSEQLRVAQGLLNQVSLLSSIGTRVDCFTLAGMMQAEIVSCNKEVVIKDPAFRLDAWSDESLFLALAICSGAIGALIAGLRTIQFTLFRDLALGFASGFIVYLGMKGGKHIFLISTADTPVMLNPYSYAFAGILVGLFTERAYNLLGSLVGELEKRLLGNVASK